MTPRGWRMVAGLFAGVLLIWGASIAWDAVRAESHPGGSRPLNPLVQVRLSEHFESEALPLGLTGDFEVRHGGENRVLFSGSNFNGKLLIDERGATMGHWLVEVPEFTIATRGDVGIRVDDRFYRGRLRVFVRRDSVSKLPHHFEFRLELPLEDYVLGVLCGEMATSTPGALEALKAQAVAARTYGLWRLYATGREYLRDNATDQRYHGMDFETEAARQAVAATRGEVLAWDDRLLPAYFHAECGGGTDNARQLDFAKFKVPPLEGARDPGCERGEPWDRVIPVEKLDEYARRNGLGTHLMRIEAEERTPSGRWLEARVTGDVDDAVVPGTELGRHFGTPSILWANVWGREDGSLLITGFGRGHGIGLCQEGAIRRARQTTTDYVMILEHYYPGAKLQPLAELPQALP